MKKYFLIFLLAIFGSAFAASSQAAEKVGHKPAITRVANKTHKKHHRAHKQAKHKGGKRARKSKAS